MQNIFLFFGKKDQLVLFLKSKYLFYDFKTSAVDEENEAFKDDFLKQLIFTPYKIIHILNVDLLPPELRNTGIVGTLFKLGTS